MAKDKDANDILVEKKKKGEKPELKVVDIDYVIPEATSKKEEYLERMNRDHAFICSFGGKPAILCWTYSEVFKRKILEFRPVDAIATTYKTIEVTSDKNPDKILGMGQWWLEHPDRREYSTIIFDPSEPPGYVPAKDSPVEKDGYWNCWEGFACKPVKGSWRLTKRHIWSVLCNKNKEKFKYFMRWLAWTVQNPGIRAEVACVFKGKKGAGKGFIFTQLAQIFGRHGMSISNSEHLTGKHNEHLMLTCFLFADEAYYPGDKGIEGVLKQLITEPYLTVEPKFRNTKLAINCLHIGMSTNAEWVVPASQDERRYFINQVDSMYSKEGAKGKESEKYFEDLWGEMDHGGREAMLYDLQKVNLKKFHPRKAIPQTEELSRQAQMSVGRPARHILVMLEDGKFPGTYNQHKEYVATSSELVNHLDNIDRNNKVPMRLKAEVLKRLGCEPIKRDDKRMWRFPPLGQMKLNWNKEFGKNDWDDYDDWEVEKRQY